MCPFIFSENYSFEFLDVEYLDENQYLEENLVEDNSGSLIDHTLNQISNDLEESVNNSNSK